MTKNRQSAQPLTFYAMQLIRATAKKNRKLDPQTPKGGLKSEKRIICGNYRKCFKEDVFKPPFGGLGGQNRISILISH